MFEPIRIAGMATTFDSTRLLDFAPTQTPKAVSMSALKQHRIIAVK